MSLNLTDRQLEPFKAMAQAGATPEQVAALAKTQYESVIQVIKILRSCFNLDFARAKELAIQAVRGISLEQHYQELFPGLKFINLLMDLELKWELQISDEQAEPFFERLLEREKQLGRELSDEEIIAALEQAFFI